jgi:hypothetical protein
MVTSEEMSPPAKRPKQLHLLLSNKEHDQFKTMANAYDMTASDYIRWALGGYWHKHLAVAKKPAAHLRAMGVLMASKLTQWDAEHISAEAKRDFASHRNV